MMPSDDAGRADDREPDLVARREKLARRAFSRNGTAEDSAELAEVEARLASSQVGVDDTLLPLGDGPLADRPLADRPLADRPPGNPSPHTDEAPAGRFGPRSLFVPRSRRVLASVAGALIVLLVSIIVVLGARLATSEAVLAGSAPTTGTDPLARFDQAQTADDIPYVVLPYDYEQSSVRRLLRPAQSTLTDYVLYAARTDRDLICLILAFPDDTTASSCVSVSEFRQHGIRVSTNVLRPSLESEGATVPVAHTVTWQSDDGFEFSSSLAVSQ